MIQKWEIYSLFEYHSNSRMILVTETIPLLLCTHFLPSPNLFNLDLLLMIYLSSKYYHLNFIFKIDFNPTRFINLGTASYLHHITITTLMTLISLSLVDLGADLKWE